MVQCAILHCSEEGKSQCARCKSVFYCGADCQKKDWPTHKRHCKRANATTPNMAPMSPYGYTFNVFSGRSIPLSSTVEFFSPSFGYVAASPALVYADLVNAYRLLRLGAHDNATLVSCALQGIDFGEWMARVTGSGILPEWWDAEVHTAGIEVYAREDAWGRLDRAVTRDEISASLAKCSEIMRLEMIVERIMNTSC
ncbi:hypothetical protein FB451DRAFT_1466631 [Mycena latifolia]|nr:hypothetical protein FB451DRAFT_1441630 [Mycena latifolia]KAJ7474103.1 hypothetical protein FB451DRAFT_1466631 [Mycena latifolia]